PLMQVFMGMVHITTSIADIFPAMGIMATASIGNALVSTHSLSLITINPHTVPSGKTILIHFAGTGFSGAGLAVNVSGAGVTVISVCNVTDSSFDAILQIANVKVPLGDHQVNVSTIAGTTSPLILTVVRKDRRSAALNIKRN